MHPDNYTKTIQERLITDLSAMRYSDNSVLLGSVKKYYIEIPTQRPFCEVMPTNFNILQDGISYDTRQESFYINVYEAIESTITDEEASIIIDRINEIKGRILRYLEKQNDILNWNLTDIEIYNVRPTNGSINTQLTEEGQVLILQINVTFDINIATKQDL